MNKISFRWLGVYLVLTALVIYACSTGGGGGTPPPNPNPCTGVTVVVSATTTNPTQGQTNGSISATATGGSGFTFSLNGGAFQASGTFSNLGAGTYTIQAKNSNGCTGSNTFTLTAINPCTGVTITVTGTTVNPTQGQTNGSITASASGGTPPYTYRLNAGTPQSSGTFNNLGAGNYSVTATDANGCTGSANFVLVATNPCTGITITVSATLTNPTTGGGNNGSIAASASGGQAPYSFSLNGGAPQASGTFNNLSAGSYVVTATDANGCTGTNTFVLTDPCTGVTITINTTVAGNTPCQTPNTGSITATASGGVGPYMYSLDGGSFQASGTFNNVSTGNHTVAARASNNCTGSTTVNVPNLPAGPLFIQVRDLLNANCVTCHNPGNPNGGMDWTMDCNIVNNRDRIRERAVNGNPSPMPPTGLLPAAERQKITNWINAGGRYID